MPQRQHQRSAGAPVHRPPAGLSHARGGARAGLPLFLQAPWRVDARATRDAHALAFTRGREIVRSPQAPSRETAAGRRLLGHELLHVAQQARAARLDPQASDAAHPALEREAEHAGDLTAVGVGPATAVERVAMRAYGTVPALQRQPAPGAPGADPAAFELVPPPMLARGMGALTLDGFAMDGAGLTGDHRGRLAVHAETLRGLLHGYPGGTVQVTGHTDATGAEAHNLPLGQRRADAVRDELVAAGAPASAVSAATEGETSPAVAAGGPEPRNRRVEIRFDPESRPRLAPTLTLTLPPTVPPAAPLAADAPPPVAPPNLKLPPSYLESKPETPAETAKRILAPIPPPPAGTGGSSVSQLVLARVDGALGSLMKRLGVPESVRPYVIKGAHAAVEKGAESLLDAALDGAGIQGEQREAIRAAVKAATQTPAP